MGTQACTCQKMVVESKLAAEDGSAMVPAMPLRDGRPSRPHGHVDGSAGASWLVTRGVPVHLRWATDPVGPRTAPPVVLPEVISLPCRVLQVAVGESHALFLAAAENGKCIFAAGGNEHGQLGLGDSLPRPDGRAVPIKALATADMVTGIACGGHISMAVSQRGTLWTWGRNEESGVLGQGLLPVGCVPSPVPVASLGRKTRVVEAATTGWTAFAVSHLGGVFSWGGGLCGTTGHGHQEDEGSAKIIRGLEGVQVARVACGALHAVALGCRGELFTWGRVAGAFGPGAQLQMVPKVVDVLLAVHIVQVAAGGEHCLALSAQGEVYGWGAHAAGVFGPKLLPDPTQEYAMVHKLELGIGQIRELACGTCHSLFLADSSSGGASAEDESRRKGEAELWVCGIGVPCADHVARQFDGPAAARAGWGQTLTVPHCTPLRPLCIDIRKVIQMTG